MNPEVKLSQLLDAHQFELVRKRKHKVFRNPRGLTFVTPSTPSDDRWSQNSLRDLKRLLRAEYSPVISDPIASAQAAPVAPPEPMEPLLEQMGPVEPSVDPIVEPPALTKPASMSPGEWKQWVRNYNHQLLRARRKQEFHDNICKAFDWHRRYCDAWEKLNGEGLSQYYRALGLTLIAKHKLDYNAKVKHFAGEIFNKGALIGEPVISLANIKTKRWWTVARPSYYLMEEDGMPMRTPTGSDAEIRIGIGDGVNTDTGVLVIHTDRPVEVNMDEVEAE